MTRCSIDNLIHSFYRRCTKPSQGTVIIIITSSSPFPFSFSCKHQPQPLSKALCTEYYAKCVKWMQESVRSIYACPKNCFHSLVLHCGLKQRLHLPFLTIAWYFVTTLKDMLITLIECTTICWPHASFSLVGSKGAWAQASSGRFYWRGHGLPDGSSWEREAGPVIW